MALPAMPMIAALSANHLAALTVQSLRRLYIARDSDPAGHRVAGVLTERARAAGIEVFVLSAVLGDFNDDLRRYGTDHLRAGLARQLARGDARFLIPASGKE